MTDDAQASSAIGGTVLVVEDEVLLRLVVAEYLRDCGYRVIEAADADAAVLVLKQPHLEIDVLFSDVEMPGSVDGFALAQWTRANPRHRVILTSGVARAVRCGGEFMRRGTDAEALSAAVDP